MSTEKQLTDLNSFLRKMQKVGRFTYHPMHQYIGLVLSGYFRLITLNVANAFMFHFVMSNVQKVNIR